MPLLRKTQHRKRSDTERQPSGSYILGDRQSILSRIKELIINQDEKVVIVVGGLLKNTKTMQTWVSSIKEPEKNNTYGWLPNPSDLPDNV
jgi:hypothetical protein